MTFKNVRSLNKEMAMFSYLDLVTAHITQKQIKMQNVNAVKHVDVKKNKSQTVAIQFCTIKMFPALSIRTGARTRGGERDGGSGTGVPPPLFWSTRVYLVRIFVKIHASTQPPYPEALTPFHPTLFAGPAGAGVV